MDRPRIILLTISAFALAIYFSYNFRLHTTLPHLLSTSKHTLVSHLSALLNDATHSREDIDQHDLSAAVDNYQGQRTAFTRHIVAVGDLHGDLPNARRVLQFSDVVDEFGNWTGNVDFFVQTGDIIDRGDDTIPLFFWMDNLRAQAIAVGGKVLSHLGNHEWMNVIGDWRYVYPSELKTFGSVAARQRMLTTGRIGRSWATNYTTTSRLPLHPSLGPPNTPYPPASMKLHYQKDSEDLHISHYYSQDDPLSHAALSFVHGGLSPTYPELTPFPSRINEISDSLLAKLQRREQPPPHPPNRYPGLPESATPEEKRLYDGNGPLWYRGWALEHEETVCNDVDTVLAKTGTRRMIMGHTPDFKNIVSRCNGKVIIIDTGISHAYGGVLSSLSIHYTLHPVGDDAENRWIEREVISALYPDSQVTIIEEERQVVGAFQVDTTIS